MATRDPSALAAPPRPAEPARLLWHVARVVEVRAETARARTLVLDVPGWPGHRAGQHVDVRLTAEDGYSVQRSYSIASAPEERHVALTVEWIPDGEVSPYLCDELRAGDGLELRGPIGGYFVWETTASRPLLLVGGGSGVVPLMAMLRHRDRADAAVRARAPARLLYSARSWDDVFYAEELERLGAEPGTAVTYVLTRTQPAGWTGHARRIDREILDDVRWPADAGADAYVCGPTAFVEVIATLLVAAGYPADRVRTERFGATG